MTFFKKPAARPLRNSGQIREKANLKNCLTVKMKDFNLAKPREIDQIQDLALVQEAGHPHQVPLKNAPGPLQ